MILCENASKQMESLSIRLRVPIECLALAEASPVPDGCACERVAQLTDHSET